MRVVLVSLWLQRLWEKLREGRVGGEVGVGCWEQLRNEPHTSTNILCALKPALEPPSAHPSLWHPFGPQPSSGGPEWVEGAEGWLSA